MQRSKQIANVIGVAVLLLTAAVAKADPDKGAESKMQKQDFGKLSDGQSADLYTLSNKHGMEVTITNFGAAVVSLKVPDKAGKSGDVVLGRDGGVIFIPPQLAEKVVQDSEHTRLRDTFGHQRLREQKYTAGQIDRGWTPEIEADFVQWMKDNIDKLPVSHAAVQEYIDALAKRAAR